MFTKTLAAPAPGRMEAPPLVRGIGKGLRWLQARMRTGASRGERMLAVEERVALGPKKSLVLVRCHHQLFLIAVSGDTIGPLTEIAKPRAARKSSTAAAQRACLEGEA